MKNKFLDTRINILNDIGEFNKNTSKAKELFSVNELINLFQSLKKDSKYKDCLSDLRYISTCENLIVKNHFAPIYFTKKI